MKETTKENLKELACDALIAAGIVVLITAFYTPTIVKQTSMEPGIDPGDYLLVSRQAYRLGSCHRGDVVVFSHESEDGSGTRRLIKRVIGIPGDIITISDGDVWINGSKVREDYIRGKRTKGSIYNLKVGKGQLFVMGDNRDVSMDSRAFGCISRKDVKGRAVLRLFPFKKAGLI